MTLEDKANEMREREGHRIRTLLLSMPLEERQRYLDGYTAALEYANKVVTMKQELLEISTFN